MYIVKEGDGLLKHCKNEFGYHSKYSDLICMS